MLTEPILKIDLCVNCEAHFLCFLSDSTILHPDLNNKTVLKGLG